MSTEYDGDKFFTVENGVRTATPLLLALAVVELSDVVFAVDSVPAVSCCTDDCQTGIDALCARTDVSIKAVAAKHLHHSCGS